MPLTSSICFAETLTAKLFDPLDSRYREYARDIRDAACTLSDLIDDLARIQTGQFQCDEERIDLHALLINKMGRVEHVAREAGVRLHLAVPNQILGLFADERFVRKIVYNMMITLIGLSPDGGEVYLSICC